MFNSDNYRDTNEPQPAPFFFGGLTALHQSLIVSIYFIIFSLSQIIMCLANHMVWVRKLVEQAYMTHIGTGAHNSTYNNPLKTTKTQIKSVKFEVSVMIYVLTFYPNGFGISITTPRYITRITELNIIQTSYQIGNNKLNVLPLPKSLCTSIVPPMDSA